MAGWNPALRFGLELAALAGLAAAGWHLTSGGMRWVVAIAVPILAAVVWGVFNVLDDPSRSGAAPVEVAGWVRLAIEVSILAGGAVALAVAQHRGVALAMAVLIVAHYATSVARIEWLVHS
jgi:hypothetical protein